MKITKKTLVYDISNLAYVIADTGFAEPHKLHQLRDICEAGNIDRVARLLGLAYSKALTVLSPVVSDCVPSASHDFSLSVRDYRFPLKRCGAARRLTPQRKLEMKETVREFMVCHVLADWLDITMPEVAESWRNRAGECIDRLSSMVNELSAAVFRRKLSPF